MSNGLETCPMRIPMIVFKDPDSPNHVQEILGWIDENRPEFDSLVQALDMTVGMFNELGADDFDASYQNFHLVKRALEGMPLPTVAGLISGAQRTPEEIQSLSAEIEANPKKQVTWMPLLYARTLKRVGIMMKRGDRIADKTEERREGVSAIGYQNTATDVQTLVVASIFQVYEEVVKTLPEFKAQLIGKNLEPDRIIEALMEVSTENLSLTQTLFEPLASQDGMDWVDGSPRFSQEFVANNLQRIR